MAGAFDFLNPVKKSGGPPPTVALDAGSQELIDQGVARANRSPEELTAEINQGAAGNAANIGQNQQQSAQADQRLGGGSPHMAEALRESYRAQSGNTIGRMMKANEYRGTLARADQMHKMSQTLMAQERVKAQNYSTLTQAYNQQEMARAQFIGQLFQTGSAGMGMAMAHKGKPSRSPNQGVGANYGAAQQGGYAPEGIDYGGTDAGSIA